MRTIDADELKTAFPCGETVRTECVRATIDHMPTIESKERTGHWILLVNCANAGVYCSRCHKKVYKEILSNTMKWKDLMFCPHCGAKMGDTNYELY